MSLQAKFVSGLVAGLVIIAIVASTDLFAQSNGAFTGDDESRDLITSVPRTMSYQGYLKDTGGQPVTDTLGITFRIYDLETGGTALWTEADAAVSIINGYFSAILGETNPMNLGFDADYWVSLQVEGDPLEMDPRLKLHMNPYSARADTAEYALNSPGSGGGWVDDGTVVRLETATDSVGIGTATPTEKLEVDGNILVSGKARIGLSNSNSGIAAFVAGFQDTASGNYSTVSGGVNNTASGGASAIGGGNFNTAGDYATVGGGTGNTGVIYATVGGGFMNTASGGSSAIGGGRDNIAGGYSSAIGGGQYNIASASYASVAGGRYNYARGQYSVVSGGGGYPPADSNSASGDYSAIGGGSRNIASHAYANVSGGFGNTASFYYASLGGGNDNTASGTYNTSVGGGANNTASGDFASVGGGGGNVASGNYSTVAGGRHDTTNTVYGGVASGYSNLAGDAATDTAAFVGGGWDNSATGPYSTVGGGSNNTASGYTSTIGGGANNTASGNFSTIGGGDSNTASGDYSLAAGRRAKANHNGTFVWADQTNADFASTSTDQFLIRASGGVGIGTTTPSHTLEVGDGFGTRYIAVNGQDGGMSGYKLMAGGTQKWFIGLPGISQLYFRNEANDDVMVLRQDSNVGVGTGTPQGALDVSSTTGAFIVPRMTTVQRNALTAVNGMIVYNTTANQFNFYENGAWVTK